MGGRYKTTLIDSEQHFFTCMRHIGTWQDESRGQTYYPVFQDGG